MKLSISLLATASYGAPERKKHQKLANDRSSFSTQPVPCSTAISENDDVPGGSPFTSIDNGQSGQVTFESYVDMVNCYADIGSSCDSNGLQVKITHMELEALMYEYYNYETGEYWYEYDDCFDTIHFDWMSKDGETTEKTDPQCGCLGENHLSCEEHPFHDYYMGVTERPTQYNLVGTDVKLVLRTDGGTSGGKIVVDWKCNTPLTTTTSTTPTTTSSTAVSTPVTNTLEMVEALLTGGFTPEMGRDYGCAGRGLFDPFAHTIGSHVDDVDAAFFTWKKCVQCATGNDKSNVLTYSYDADTDTCANGPSRSFCECDRALMKFLNESVPSHSDYQAELCVPGYANSLECCQYNKHFWAHYNPDRSCCGPDGVKEMGSC